MPPDFLDIVYLQLSFAIKLLSYIENNKIVPLDFDNIGLHLQSKTNPSNVILIPDNQFPSNDNLRIAAENHVLMCIGALAITLWTAIEKKYNYITKNKSLSSEEDKLAGLIYMIRCCYAHNMAEPRWNITKDKYKILYQVGGNSIDLRHMNGEIFTQDSIGGDSTLWLLRKECKSKGMI